MQSSTGQYSTHAGDPAHPVQHSVITANSLGFFLRGVASPLDLGSNLSSSGTIPTALVAPGAAGMRVIIAQKLEAAEWIPPLAHYESVNLLVFVFLMVFVVMPPAPVVFLPLMIELGKLNVSFVLLLQPSTVSLILT